MNMNYFNLGLQHDLQRNINDAAHYYQKSIKENEGILDAYTNLAFIHWEIFGELPFRDMYDVKEELLYSSDISNVYGLLKQAQVSFPRKSEPIFWEKYIKEIENGPGHLSLNEAKKLATEDTSTLIPYFFIIEYEKTKEYLQKAKKLYAEVSKYHTVKNGYVMGILMLEI